jgi:hypothetical protein
MGATCLVIFLRLVKGAEHLIRQKLAMPFDYPSRQNVIDDAARVRYLIIMLHADRVHDCQNQPLTS